MPRSAAGAGDRSALLGWLAFLTVSGVWGSTFLAIAVGLRSFTPWGMIALRFGTASVLCLALGRLLGEAWPERPVVRHLALSGAVLLGVCNALVTWSELHVASGLAATLCAPVPIFIALMTLKTEPLGVRGWAGALLGVAGVVVLVAPWKAPPGSLAGAGAILVSTVLWAWATLYVKGNVSGGGLLTNAGIQMLPAAVIGLLAGPVTGGYLRAPLVPSALVAVLYLAVVGSCLAFTAFGYLTHAWPAGRAGTYAYLNPAVAVLLGALLLDEPFGARLLAGMLVLLLGVGLVQLRARG